MSALKNYYLKLDKYHRASFIFYGAFYFLVITNFVIFYDFFTSEKSRDYELPLFKMLWTCIFGIGGIILFFKGNLKNSDWGLKILTLLTFVTLCLILWFVFSPI